MKALSAIRHVSNKSFAVLASLVLAASLCLPTMAWAAPSDVHLDNHTVEEGAQLLSGLVIDDVDAPQAGQALDDTAQVTSDQGAEWEIPVLWVNPSLQLATQAEEGTTRLPVLAFYVPDGYALQGDEFTVALSESLYKLFGGEEIISIYDANTGITYILPSSIRAFFAPAKATVLTLDAASSLGTATPVGPAAAEPSWIDIFCAQTAIDGLSESDLYFLLDLIINKLQPQAVELLLEKFPAFATAASNGQIGREIGLYVYLVSGDKDGLPEHADTPEDALAYVYADAINRGGIKYCYLLGVDVTDLLKVNKDGSFARNANGTFVLVREGKAIETLKNTLVHEMFHAFMDDYNRTGMMGGTNPADVITDSDGNFASQALADRYRRIVFPRWFTEGSASAVENVYQYRNDSFRQMRETTPGSSQYYDWYDKNTFLVNYITGKNGQKPLYADLFYSWGVDENGTKINNTQSAYVMGYVAILYLSELKARATTGSAVWTDGESVSVSSDKLRMGLNGILEDLHNGATLDQVIRSISPVDSKGKKIYQDTDAFESLFIKGAPDKKSVYWGDKESLSFAVTLLNYLQAISVEKGRTSAANGSILFDFSKDFTAPLNENKNASSDCYAIVESNELVESTVANSEALQGGGKSNPDAGQNATGPQGSADQQAARAFEANGQDVAALPLAAKTSGSSMPAADAGTGASTATAAPTPAASTAPAIDQAPAPADSGTAEAAVPTPTDEPTPDDAAEQLPAATESVQEA